MDSNLFALTEPLKKNPPAGEETIETVTSKLDFSLPKDYIAFLSEMNGAEGFVGNSYLSLWSFENLLEYNEKYQADLYAPGYFIFGSDGGGTAYAFDKKSGTIVAFELVGMLIDDEPQIAGNDLSEFFNFLLKS